MQDADEWAERYLACWNERDPGRRAGLVRELWADDAVYVDPLVTAEGPVAVDQVLATAQRQFPDLAFRRACTADGHHHVVRVHWEMAPHAGPAVIIGLALLVTDRRLLRQVYGFLDPVPSPGRNPMRERAPANPRPNARVTHRPSPGEGVR